MSFPEDGPSYSSGAQSPAVSLPAGALTRRKAASAAASSLACFSIAERAALPPCVPPGGFFLSESSYLMTALDTP